MTTAPALLSIGVAAALGPDRIAAIAPVVEAAGFARLWVNDTPGADALVALGAAASVTTTLGLATGVLPLDRRTPSAIIAAASALPHERLTLGVGSGAVRRGALDLVEQGVTAVRAGTGCRVLVGALGPRMRALGARIADGVLLSWLPPAAAGEQRAQAYAQNPASHVALSVRTAVDDAALPRLRRESERYAGFDQYGANLSRVGTEVSETVLPGARGGLAAYRGAADEVVLRAIVAEDTEAAYAAFIAEMSRQGRTSA